MKKTSTILIADRNPRVRKFLQREMSGAGYQVHLADNCRQILFWILHHNGVDLLVMDPDFPGQEAHLFLSELRRRSPELPVIIHSHGIESIIDSNDLNLWFVEKNGNSIETLMRTVNHILNPSVKN